MSERPLSPFALEVLGVLHEVCCDAAEYEWEYAMLEQIYRIMFESRKAKTGHGQGLNRPTIDRALKGMERRGLCREIELRWWQFLKLPDKSKPPTNEQGRLF